MEREDNTMIEGAVLEREVETGFVGVVPGSSVMIRTDELWKTYVMGAEEVHALRGVSFEVQQGESVVRDAIAAARSGRGFAPAELIALQAGVYRYSEAVDLAAKLVDRATSGLKTVVQGQ